MKIGFFLSSLGGSPLQVGLGRGMVTLGHTVHYVTGLGDPSCDLLLIFNQTAHNRDYAYPQFPSVCSVPFVFIDCAECGPATRTPERIPLFWNAFTDASMTHDTKNTPEQTRLRDWLRGRSFPYLLREYFRNINYPQSYHPIEYPLYLHSENHTIPNREEYLTRKLDLFVAWGLSHPFRESLSAVLRSCPVNSEINIIGENGWPRMNQREYFAKMVSAKCSVNFDGYGSSAFRLNEILARCLLLLGPLCIKRSNPLTDGVNCIEYGIESSGDSFLSTNIAEKLQEALADPERSFRIHEAGYYHNIEYYSETATAARVLAIVHAHDWSKPTPLDNTEWNVSNQRISDGEAPPQTTS